MNVDTAIVTRTAVRTFDPEHVLDAADQRRLLELARRAPSAWNVQQWRFVVIDDTALRQSLCTAAMGQTQVIDCSLFVAIVVDLDAWKRNPARYFDAFPDDVADLYADKVRSFYEGRDWLARDDAMRSCGLAAQTLMLASTAMGLASCPMDLFDEARVSQLLNLPDAHVVAMFVAIGKAVVDPDLPRMGRLPFDEVVVRNRFPAG